MAVTSALRSCQWTSDWAKIDFIRNLLEGNAFHNVAVRADPDFSINTQPYRDNIELIGDLASLYGGADK